VEQDPRDDLNTPQRYRDDRWFEMKGKRTRESVLGSRNLKLHAESCGGFIVVEGEKDRRREPVS
jgi:hypothetical protein